MFINFSEVASPTVLLAQSLKVIHGFQMLWLSVLSHVDFDLRKLLPGQQEITLPPIAQQLTLQILLQAPPMSLKWYQQVCFNKKIGHFPFSSVSKRVQVQINLSYENEFYSQVHSNANQTHFYMKGFTLGLVLKQRQKATGKWPTLFKYQWVMELHCTCTCM